LERDDLIEILIEIRNLLERIERKMDEIAGRERKRPDIDPLALLELPGSLRTTYMALMELKEATAEEVASVTGRGRPSESHYLNTLVKMGYASKKRVGKKVYYFLG